MSDRGSNKTKKSAMPARKKPVLGRRSVADAQQTRERILNVAQHYFSTVGYNEASNTKIASAAGITAAALYKHFKSKSEMYAAVCQRAQEQLSATHFESIRDCKDPREALNRIIDNGLREYYKNPSMQSFLAKVPVEVAHNTELALPLAEKISNTLQEQIIEVIRKGQKEGNISKSVSAEMISQMYVTTLMGLVLSGARNGMEIYVETVKAFKMMLNGTLFKTEKLKSGK